VNKILAWTTIAVLVVVAVVLWQVVSNRGVLLEPTTQVQEPSQVKQIVVALAERSDSSMSGAAYLVETEEGIWVILDLEGAPRDVAQPAHIHNNKCENIGSVLYPLEFPVNGFSQTLLNVKTDELKAKLPLSINVHKSAEESQTYVACGNIEL